jgi:glucose-6-phosphate 1-dehydrogenase
LRLWIDNWRWMDVPFFIRDGKNLPVTCTAHNPAPNHVRMRISPDILRAIGMNVVSPADEAVTLAVEMLASRHPGAGEMDAYERVLGDAIYAVAHRHLEPSYWLKRS